MSTSHRHSRRPFHRAAAALTLGAAFAVALMLWLQRSLAAAETVGETPSVVAVEAPPAEAPSAQESSARGDGDLTPLVDRGPRAGRQDAEQLGLEELPARFDTAAPFDVSQLKPLNVVVRDAETKVPLRGVPCFVTDRYSVVLEAVSDAAGRLRSEELAYSGPVTLQFVGPRARFYLDAGMTMEDLALGLKGNESLDIQTDYRLPVTEGLIHTGDPDRADIWEVQTDRLIALRLRAPVSPARALFVLVSPGRRSDMTRAPTLEIAQVQRPAWAGVQGRGRDEFLRALTIEDDPRKRLIPMGWDITKLGDRVPGRVLRGVLFSGDRVLVAEADAATLPAFEKGPLDLSFQWLQETQWLQEKGPDRLRELYGRMAGQMIADFLLRQSQAAASRALGSASIIGTITSQSGEFQGGVTVRAEPTEYPLERGVSYPKAQALVEWSQSATGAYVGSFELKGLANVLHRVSVRPESDVLLGDFERRVLAPHRYSDGALVIKDQVRLYPVELHVTGPANVSVYGSTCKLTCRIEGESREAWGGAPPPPPEGFAETYGPVRIRVPIQLPDGHPFDVELTAPGYVPLKLSQVNFQLKGGELVATPVMGLE